MGLAAAGLPIGTAMIAAGLGALLTPRLTGVPLLEADASARLVAGLAFGCGGGVLRGLAARVGFGGAGAAAAVMGAAVGLGV